MANDCRCYGQKKGQKEPADPVLTILRIHLLPDPYQTHDGGHRATKDGQDKVASEEVLEESEKVLHG